MPGWNTTVQDYSPLISYSPLGAWSAEYNSTGSFYEFYNDKYTSTSTINATASFECNGTGIWIYGAKGPNHGAYTVTLDGMVNTLNATSTEWLQTLLFAAPALGAGRHVVEVSNTGGAMVSVDLVECQHSTAEDENLIQQMFVDVGSRPWVYEGDWMMNSDASSTSTSGIQTSGSNASATLQFRGTHVDVYGHTSPTCGSFLVSLDDVTDPRTFNCTSSITHAQVLLYSRTIRSVHIIFGECSRYFLEGRITRRPWTFKSATFEWYSNRNHHCPFGCYTSPRGDMYCHLPASPTSPAGSAASKHERSAPRSIETSNSGSRAIKCQDGSSKPSTNGIPCHTFAVTFGDITAEPHFPATTS